ncbi:MAG: DUF547 domain-containing protein [Deltaproteobacteria bacterium]|nr:DUF547 domain-containing protein [Deltaproteobacteria bacterium]
MALRMLVAKSARRRSVATTAAAAASLALALVDTPAMALTAPEARERFSHAEWTAVLEHFVDEEGRVDYEALARDRAGLDALLARLARQGPKSTPSLFPSRNDQLAYYLNAYNALVFRGVLSRGPEKESVWTGGLFSGYSFFVSTKVRLDGEIWSLKALEDDLIRRDFADPRVHAALNCASLGCPRLPREAFVPENLDAHLDAAMREFVEVGRNVATDPARKSVTLSKIFGWFEKDFLSFERANGNPDPKIVDYVNRYRASKPKLDRSFRVRYFDYDKRINAR